MTSTPKRLVGAEKGPRLGCGGAQGTGCPPHARPAPRGADRGESSARRSPPTPGGVGRAGAGQWARGQRARASARLRKGKEKRGAGGGGGRQGRSRRCQGRGRGSGPTSAASPPQTQQRREGSPGRALPGRLGAGAGVGGRFASRTGRETPSWGGGFHRSAPRGEEPPPRRGPRLRPRTTAAAPRARACPTRGGGGAGKHWEPREGGDAAKEKVGFESVSFYRVGGAPVRAGARVAGRAGSRGPGPAGGALRSQGPSPRLGPG